MHQEPFQRKTLYARKCYKTEERHPNGYKTKHCDSDPEQKHYRAKISSEAKDSYIDQTMVHRKPNLHRAPGGSRNGAPRTKIKPKTAHRTPKSSPARRISHQQPPKNTSRTRTKAPIRQVSGSIPPRSAPILLSLLDLVACWPAVPCCCGAAAAAPVTTILLC